jgi:hypothetical protein
MNPLAINTDWYIRPPRWRDIEPRCRYAHGRRGSRRCSPSATRIRKPFPSDRFPRDSSSGDEGAAVSQEPRTWIIFLHFVMGPTGFSPRQALRLRRHGRWDNMLGFAPLLRRQPMVEREGGGGGEGRCPCKGPRPGACRCSGHGRFSSRTSTKFRGWTPPRQIVHLDGRFPSSSHELRLGGRGGRRGVGEGDPGRDGRRRDRAHGNRIPCDARARLDRSGV